MYRNFLQRLMWPDTPCACVDVACQTLTRPSAAEHFNTVATSPILCGEAEESEPLAMRAKCAVS
jgi:hypothetical protein